MVGILEALLPMNRSLALLVLTAGSAFAQAFSVGVKGGIPLTNLFETGSNVESNYYVTSSTTNRYIVGASLEVRLYSRLAVEFDILYRHLNYRDGYLFDPQVFGTEHVEAGDWELPLLVKYHLTRGVVRPYVGAGPALDVLSISDSFVQFPSALGVGIPTISGEKSTSGVIQSKTAIGFAVAAGLDAHVGPLRFSPEIRYTNWTSPHSSNSNRGQAEILLGVTF
jgi:opacity protein-like surface antigen